MLLNFDLLKYERAEISNKIITCLYAKTGGKSLITFMDLILAYFYFTFILVDVIKMIYSYK